MERHTGSQFLLTSGCNHGLIPDRQHSEQLSHRTGAQHPRLSNNRITSPQSVYYRKATAGPDYSTEALGLVQGGRS